MENFKLLCQAILLVIAENKASNYFPDWLYKFWQGETPNMESLKSDIADILQHIKAENELDELKLKLIERLDLERYVVAVHVGNYELRLRIQEAMLVALFFSTKDAEQFRKLVLSEQEPQKFLEYLNCNEELLRYKVYLRKQYSVFGRLIKNLTDEEITIAAKGYMINGKLFEFFGLEDFLKHGFHYIKKELKALQIHKIEKGYLNAERINGYMEKIALIMHPANELRMDHPALVKNARNLLEDIINTAELKEAGVPLHSEHAAIIKGCYWVDELFKTAAASFTSFDTY